jgi:hypothetical protein
MKQSTFCPKEAAGAARQKEIAPRERAATGFRERSQEK